jgi:hypothetical protein
MFRIKKHSRHKENFVSGRSQGSPGFERRFNKFGIDRKATKLVVRIFSAFLFKSLNGFKSTFYNTRSFAA